MTRISLLLIALLLPGWADEGEMNWRLARELRDRAEAGEILTESEQEMLDCALAIRAERDGGGGDGGATDGDDGSVSDGSFIDIPEKDSPVFTTRTEAIDGMRSKMVYRLPPGDGPFPTVITLHGGTGSVGGDRLIQLALEGPVRTRLLAAGYAVVTPTRRGHRDWLQDPGPILDTIAQLEFVQSMPWADPASIFFYGGSGGGSLALEMASEPGIAGIIVGEPASIIYTGLATSMDALEPCMSDPLPCYTEALQLATEAKIASIQTPILVLHGDVHPLRHVNNDIMRPAFDALGVGYEWILWPRYHHGFYWGEGMDPGELAILMQQVYNFLEPRAVTDPVGWFKCPFQ